MGVGETNPETRIGQQARDKVTVDKRKPAIKRRWSAKTTELLVSSSVLDQSYKTATWDEKYASSRGN